MPRNFMRSSINLVGILVVLLLFFTCGESENLRVSPSFLYLYNGNVVLTNSIFDKCKDATFARSDEPFLVPNSHYCVGQDFIDHAFRNSPGKLKAIKPVDSLLSILVTCIRFSTNDQECSLRYSRSSQKRNFSALDSVITNDEQLFWFLRMPNLTAQMVNSNVREIDDPFYSTYTFEFKNSTRVDTLFTDFNIYLRACDGC